MTISIPEKLAPQQSLYYNRTFSRFWTHSDDRPKILTYHQTSPNIYLLTNCPIKIKVSQAQDNWFILKEASTYKRGVHRSAHPRYE